MGISIKMNQLIDALISQCKLANDHSPSFVSWPFIIVVCLPMIVLTNWQHCFDFSFNLKLFNNECFATVFIFLNTFVRLSFPCCYVPASKSKNQLIYSPIVARAIATIAELC